jgi:hypothetical protein
MITVICSVMRYFKLLIAPIALAFDQRNARGF